MAIIKNICKICRIRIFEREFLPNHNAGLRQKMHRTQHPRAVRTHMKLKKAGLATRIKE